MRRFVGIYENVFERLNIHLGIKMSLPTIQRVREKRKKNAAAAAAVANYVHVIIGYAIIDQHGHERIPSALFRLVTSN